MLDMRSEVVPVLSCNVLVYYVDAFGHLYNTVTTYTFPTACCYHSLLFSYLTHQSILLTAALIQTVTAYLTYYRIWVLCRVPVHL